MKLTREIIDNFVPHHTVLRYEIECICSDEDRRGGIYYDFANKEWRCKRCVLLDLLEKGEIPDWVQIDLEVDGYGNVL